MAVYRVERNKNYTVMCNCHLQDKNISLKAKGLLSMMLSFPENWSYSIRGLASRCKEGVDAIGSALKELEKAGYIVRRLLRGDNGRIMDTEYIIYECPQDHNPGPENPGPAGPAPTSTPTPTPTPTPAGSGMAPASCNPPRRGTASSLLNADDALELDGGALDQNDDMTEEHSALLMPDQTPELMDTLGMEEENDPVSAAVDTPLLNQTSAIQGTTAPCAAIPPTSVFTIYGKPGYGGPAYGYPASEKARGIKYTSNKNSNTKYSYYQGLILSFLPRGGIFRFCSCARVCSCDGRKE